MGAEIYRYTFSEDIPAHEIESTLYLAILAAESLHGRSEVRLQVSYSMDAEEKACVVDGRTDAGNDVARIFTGFIMREFGEEAFRVERVRTERQLEPAGVSA